MDRTRPSVAYVSKYNQQSWCWFAFAGFFATCGDFQRFQKMLQSQFRRAQFQWFSEFLEKFLEFPEKIISFAEKFLSFDKISLFIVAKWPKTLKIAYFMTRNVLYVSKLIEIRDF